MTRRKASFLQGTTAAPYLLPAEDHRLNHAGLWAPSSLPGAAALAVQNGIVWGPGNPGAVTVVAGGVNVAPFHATVQGSRSGVQGVFELTSDASEFRAITAASGTTYRKGRIGIRVYDQGAGATKDDWDIEVLYGTAAATAGAATLPAVPLDSTWFELRTFDVSNTGAITLSGTTARTTGRGGILPIEAGDVTPGAYVGQYRDHPTSGLQRWDGAAWTNVVLGRWVDLWQGAASHNVMFPSDSNNWQTVIPGGGNSVPHNGGAGTASPTVAGTPLIPCPVGLGAEIEFYAPIITYGSTNAPQMRLRAKGVTIETSPVSIGANMSIYMPVRLRGVARANADGSSIPVHVEMRNAGTDPSYLRGPQWQAGFSEGPGPYLRYRLTP